MMFGGWSKGVWEVMRGDGRIEEDGNEGMAVCHVGEAAEEGG